MATVLSRRSPKPLEYFAPTALTVWASSLPTLITMAGPTFTSPMIPLAKRALYHSQKNGTFEDIAIDAGCALSPDGKPQAGMGVSAGDYDLDGNLDLVKDEFRG